MKILPKISSAGTAPTVKRVFLGKQWRRMIGLAVLAAIVIGSALVYAAARRDIRAAHRWSCYNVAT